MAIKMERLESFLLTAQLKFRTAKAGHLVVGFATNHYVSADGTRGVAVAIRLDEDGRFLECIAPALYDLADCPHRDAVLRLLVMIMQRSKLIRFDFDADDGEVRGLTECPIEDGSLTREQFLRLLSAIPELVDRWDPAIRRALKTGEVRLEPAEPSIAD